MGAPRTRKSLIKSRRRVKDDDGEEEGSVAAGVEDDSLSEASMISDADDDADAEGSDGSDTGSPGKKESDAAAVANGHSQGGTRGPSENKSSGQIQAPVAEPSVDTDTMMNGLKISDETEGEVLNFDDLNNDHQEESQESPHIQRTSSAGNQGEKAWREHEEYKKRRDADPAFVPNRGGFFMHDHRSSAPGQNGFRPFGRNKVRGRGNGVFPAFGQMQSGPADAPWAHDLHDTVTHSEPIPEAPKPIIQDRQRPPIAVMRAPLPNRSFSGSRHVGNVQIRILLRGMTEPIVFSAVPVNQHTRLPHHRPPLRRDKPVRISLPDSPIRYIFPATERSFIFIPRALRPNQQGFGRMRGRGSFGGGYGSFGPMSSKRTSVYAGSGYSPSVAMSRRSSLAREVAADGVSSPATGSFPRPTGVVMEGGKPVVRLPPPAEQAQIQAQFSGQQMIAHPMAPTVNLPQPSSYPVLPKPAISEGRPESLPMHHPKPERTLQVGDIDSPATLDFNPPQPQQQQPFHQQVPQLGTYQPEAPQFQHSRHPSHPSQVGTPSQNISEANIHTQSFQPYQFPQQQGYYPQPYAPPVFFYPSAPQPNAASSAAAPPFVPGQQYFYPVPMAPPQPSAPEQATSSQTVAHESGGMVYYYNSADLARSAETNAQYAPNSYAPPPMAVSEMVPYFPAPAVYYPPQPPQQTGARQKLAGVLIPCLAPPPPSDLIISSLLRPIALPHSILGELCHITCAPLRTDRSSSSISKAIAVSGIVMASTVPKTNPGSPVHVKISISGKDETRKFKLTLEDLDASILPNKLRSLLSIPEPQEAIFERYSDSAASFITLDSSNEAVYKQLRRAAKAKGKLRLRVTLQDGIVLSSSEPPKAKPSPDRLTSRRYVHPYVSDVTGQPLSQESRSNSSGEEPKLTHGHPTIVAEMKPATQDEKPIDTGADNTQGPKTYFWPVTENPAWSEATKSAFDSATKRSTQDSLRKIKEMMAARATSANLMTSKAENDEAPVPRYFTARDHCRAQHNATQEPNPGPRNHFNGLKSCTSFTICCNTCDAAIPDAHWHCSVCDDGDFDLCLDCVQRGTLCNDESHWLIKRTVENGKVVNSTTETIAPKKFVKIETEKDILGALEFEAFQESVDLSRTCNSCVQVYDESQFVTCTVCDDYDLCIPCHVAQKHGHHPSHGFKPATANTVLTTSATSLLGPGRNTHHWAICDGCNDSIYGVRHKCLKCPDWDFCTRCIKAAKVTHPGHRFVPLYEPITNIQHSTQKHDGIYCDGPLCLGKTTYIRGDRYKCAVCRDTDFCATCEALPRLPHNRTHPLLKFKTPVRNVSVSTYGGKQDGSPMMAMGDQIPQTTSKATETNAPAASANAATQVQTVAECKPSMDATTVAPNAEPETPSSNKPGELGAELNAYFVGDTVCDGTVVAPGVQFTQVWTLRNPGPHSWPAGCTVCFIGGDAMLDVDTSQPSHVTHIRKATKSNTVEREIRQGEAAEFSVVMRAPEREGNAISYWRLKAPDGTPFGHKLWCDINMKKPEEKSQHESQMIFPKLDKESPVSSQIETQATTPAAPRSAPLAEDEQLLEDVESLELDNDDQSSEEGFLTDEEYELIASGDEMEEAKNGKK